MAEAKKDDRSFNKRLMDAMAEMENPTKSKTADTGKIKYKYETLDQVLAVVRPALTKNGLAFTQSQRFDSSTGGFVLDTIVFDDGESRTMDSRPMPARSDAQQAGSWETYMRRYALRTAFGLTGEDDDGAATKSTNNQNHASKRNTAAQSDVFKGAKVTEMASDALMGKLDEKIDQLAVLRNKTAEEVKKALMDSKTMSDASDYANLTAKQANTALCLLVKWLGDANNAEDDAIADSLYGDYGDR